MPNKIMYRLKRFSKKPKELPAAKMPYITFNAHSLTPCIASEDNLIYITTIDPGIKNCCIRCSAFNPYTGRSKTLTQSLINFAHTSLYQSSSDTDTADIHGIETTYYSSIYKTLDPFIPLFVNSHYIGIESQLPINYDLVRMSQHIITYIMCVIRDKGNRPYILELDSRLKTSMLNAPSKMTKPQRKKWARDKGIEILESMGESNISYILESSKGDDHGDTICYEQVIIMIILGRSSYIPPPSIQLTEVSTTASDTVEKSQL